MSHTAPEMAPRMKVLGMSVDAWRLAGSHALTHVEVQSGADLSRLRLGAVEEHLEGLSPQRIDDLWSELLECGIATAPHQLAGAWAAALVEATHAPIGIRIVSGIPGMSIAADLTVQGDRGMCVARRQQLAEGPLGGAEVIAEDTRVEVTLFNANDVWAAVRRILPPLEQLRADPTFTPSGARTMHVLDDSARAAFVEQTQVTSLESAGVALKRVARASAGLDDALNHARAEVSLAVMASPPGRGKSAVAFRLWSLGQNSLYSIATRDADGPVAIEVEAGDIGSQLVWLVTGAVEHVSAAVAGGDL